MKHKKLLISLLIMLALSVAVLLTEKLTPGIQWIFTPSGKVSGSLLSEVDEAEHIDTVPDGEIRYLINNNVIFERSGGKGSFMFENPGSSQFDLVFTVYEIVGDGGEENMIYTSPVIKPGSSLSGDKLGKRLGNGRYDCVYTVQAYSGSEYAGERSGSLTLTVLNQSI